MPRILVLIVKLGARYGRRLATPIPSSNGQIPCISTLRIGWNLPQTYVVRYHLRKAQISLLRSNNIIARLENWKSSE